MKAEPVVFRQKLSGMVNTFERMAGVDLTIHDVRGILSTQESSMILPGRFLHNGLYCRRERFERPVWNNRCTFDCKTSVYEELHCHPGPFVKTCWKGVREVVVPVMRQGRIMLVLFAGVFRAPGGIVPERAGTLPDFYLKYYKSLPELTDKKIRELTGLLTLLGNALLAELEEIDAVSKSGTREQMILNFIKKNAHRKVTVRELAEHLNLSVSRTSHTVCEQLGKTFKEAVLEERMGRAVFLLNSNPHLTTGKIARMVGFSDEHYFIRCFSKFYGMGPRSWQRAEAEKIDAES